MSWFKLESSFRDHRKILRLARRLNVTRVEARGLVVGLFCRVSSEAPDGCLDSWEPEEIADAADFAGDPKELWEALVELNWIVFDGNSVEINGWLERAQAHREALRQRKRRSEKKDRTGTVHVRSQDGTGTVQVPSQDSTVTVRGTDRQTDREDRQTERTDGQTDNTVDLKADYLARAEKGIVTNPVKPKVDQSDEVLSVYEHYRKYHPRAHAKPNSKSKEWRSIKDRLAEGCTVEDLRGAIDGCHGSAWHQGHNDRKRSYNSLELIMRDGGKVHQFLEMLQKNPAEGLSDQTLRNVRAAFEFAQENNND